MSARRAILLTMYAAVPFSRLDGVARADVLGLLRERGGAARSEPVDRDWERAMNTWRAVGDALEMLADGRRPATPSDNPPRWLESAVRWRLGEMAETLLSAPEFLTIRTLERLEVVSLVPDSDYVLAFVGGLSAWSADGRLQARALREDPAMLDRCFWPMFTVEGGGQVSLTNADKYGGGSWCATVVELVDDGTVDRGRVLDSCLDALVSDLGAYQAGWFSRTLTALLPTPDELAARQAALLAVARSTVPASVTFAVDRLRDVEKAGILDDRSVAAGLGAVFATAGKGTATKAVRLLETLAARLPEDPAVVDTAVRALDQPHVDVQARALDVLERAVALDRALGAPVHPTLAARVSPPPAALDPSPADPPEWSLPSLRLPGPVSADELLERTAALLEDASDPLEVEQVLAALSAVGDASVLAPLARRARTVAERDRQGGEWGSPVAAAVAELVLTACGIPLPPDPYGVAPPVETGFLRARLAEIGSTMTGGTPRSPLLATPTSGPWVAPDVLVARLLATLRAPASPRHHDLVGALLRLHADGRPSALGAWRAAGISADPALSRVVVHALGGPPPSSDDVRRDIEGGLAAWWVAAARARDPLGIDPVLVEAGLGTTGRGLPVTASVRPRAEHSYGQTHWRFTVAVPRESPYATTYTEPPAVTSRTIRHYETDHLADWHAWAATTFPHDAEHFLVAGVRSVLDASLTWSTREPDVPIVLDALLTHPGRTGALAASTVAAGLAAREQTDRIRAADVFAALVVPGRVGTTELADAMALLAPAATVTRWGPSLGDAAEVGPGARAAVVDVLVRLLPRLDRGTRGLSSLLDRLEEESARVGRAVVEDGTFRDWAARFTGSSRAARTARRLVSPAAGA
ncbi:DUF6493 family protein [Cellulosimicrobium sp. NPDC057862]|uniref:DUF6493 family protein n=1 Tax=Cellulosimicrobium sp. NPDC057862 TaxID=3346266 RepID=UPI003671738E